MHEKIIFIQTTDERNMECFKFLLCKMHECKLKCHHGGFSRGSLHKEDLILCDNLTFPFFLIGLCRKKYISFIADIKYHF